MKKTRSNGRKASLREVGRPEMDKEPQRGCEWSASVAVRSSIDRKIRACSIGREREIGREI